MESAPPALCRLQLGTELRRLRMESGHKAGAVAKRLLWSPSKITRLEKGENAIVELTDVMALCEVYGADAETRSVLEGYAVVTKTRRDWWQSPKFRPVIRPSLRAFIGQEATAERLQTYQSEFVPGLLQSEPYVRALHQAAHIGLDEADVDLLVTMRMTRQEVLHRPDSPLKLTAVVNESVLRREVGGTAVARQQLGYMADLARLPNVRLQVVPFKVGVHPAMDGQFTILAFAKDAGLRPLIYMEKLADDWVVREDRVVTKYQEAFDELQAVASSPQDSLRMIDQAIKEL
ncbi:helix-turn-helix domain-containing protein [Yinghuangia sp. ASG 101]|uniref:helix-turn-helix domain-containing protein n=1 Tax=Yinghuangia sp. ASG 101 TaxID=2896848 RepID=UPI001E65C038|nr:helix-turn-helix transcriptional regulator [Yinghuangia sp. ASG 101]UGQ09422.1 helix-turn-helix domain-containing protein [Yinghuangia sp. ASG 101]